MWWPVMQNSARLTVPRGPSIACSNAKAIEWDAAWLNNVDPFGRAAVRVHLSPFDKHVTASNAGMMHSEIGGGAKSMMEFNAPGLAIQN
ncbi:hypothetical protein EUGRSUZ_E01055 [Eucalyptus grandis]|uniref:Uncharacterized protein n=2 Tax=Eucalyptus grandis TaxID=71139 RepID=A0ACC3KT32_EUCGR|nr:hypothetical protein EUGRSUZ_E01055 [Eucalyptus grandis]